MQDAVARQRVDDAGGTAEAAAVRSGRPARREFRALADRVRRPHHRRLVRAAARRRLRRAGGAAPGRAPGGAPAAGAAPAGAPAGARGRGRLLREVQPASAAAAPFERHTLPGSPITLRYDCAARPPPAGGAVIGRRHERHDPRRARRHAAGALRRRGRERGIEMALPDDVAGVVVERVDVVRAAGDDRHRHEQRDAVRGDAVRQPVHAARPVIQLRAPLPLEPRLRHGLRRRSSGRCESRTSAARRRRRSAIRSCRGRPARL